MCPELAEVARPPHAEHGLDRARAIERAPAQRELRLLLLEHRREDRTVPRGRDVYDHVVRAALHLYHFAPEGRVLHASLEFIAAQVRGILALNEEVLRVGVGVGEAPRDTVVVPDHDAGHARYRE